MLVIIHIIMVIIVSLYVYFFKILSAYRFTFVQFINIKTGHTCMINESLSTYMSAFALFIIHLSIPYWVYWKDRCSKMAAVKERKEPKERNRI